MNSPWYCNVCEVSGVSKGNTIKEHIESASRSHRERSPDCKAATRFLKSGDWYRILMRRPSTGDRDIQQPAMPPDRLIWPAIEPQPPK